MSFMEIAQVDQIPPGSMKSFNIKGTSVFIVNIGGSFYAMGNKCTHMGGDLSKGMLEGKIVTCPRHGSQFDVTSGKRMRGPAKKDETVYKVKIEGNGVQVDI
jgi:nitrite reductase/ring-hydroxylating ferredoxin subunit